MAKKKTKLKTKKSKSIFDSLWLNTIMLALSIFALVLNTIDKRYIFVILWIILVYHFVRQVMKAKKK